MRVSDLTLGTVVGVEDRTVIGRRRVREGSVVGYHRRGVTVQLSAWPQDRYRFRSDGSPAGWLTPRHVRLVRLPKGRRR